MGHDAKEVNNTMSRRELQQVRVVRRIALCCWRPPVAGVGKAPMIAIRFTEHRTYNDGRYGPNYSNTQWARTMRLSKASLGKNSRF